MTTMIGQTISQQRLPFVQTRCSFGTIQQKKLEVGFELSNATSSIYWIFVPLFDEAHNPKVVSVQAAPIIMSPIRCGTELHKLPILAALQKA
jgi:hypothetical protein